MVKNIYINTSNLIFVCFFFLLTLNGFSQKIKTGDNTSSKQKTGSSKILYGQASYYAAKFEGRKTASGEIFKHSKLTAACNVLPLGTWIKVTNLRNGKSVNVKTNDRLHASTKRIVDLTKTGAQKLGYYTHGLTRVKIEVLKHKP